MFPYNHYIYLFSYCTQFLLLLLKSNNCSEMQTLCAGERKPCMTADHFDFHRNFGHIRLMALVLGKLPHNDYYANKAFYYAVFIMYCYNYKNQ